MNADRNAPLRVAQIGVGHDHAADIMQALRKMPQYFDILGYAAEDEPVSVENAPVYGGVPRMTAEQILSLPDLDAVFVESSEEYLVKYAQRAAERGLGVHMDKPGSFSLPDFSALVQTVKQKDVAFSVGYMYRYNPVVREIIARAKKGEFGEIYSVEAHMDCLHTEEKRKWLNKFPGGMMFFLGCHLIDILYAIQGEPQEIIPFNASTGEYSGKDLGMAVFRYPNGVSFLKSCAREPGGFARRQLVVCGTECTAIVEPLEMFEPAARTTLRTAWRTIKRAEAEQTGWNCTGEKHISSPYDRYRSMLLAFYNACRGDRSALYPPDYEEQLFKILLLACGS